MKWFRKTRIGIKLGFGFAVMILFMSVIGWSGYRSAASIQHSLEDIFAVRLPSIDYLIQADRDLQQLLVAERSMIFANAKSDVFKTLVEEYEQNLKQSQDRWNKYKVLAASAEEKAIISKYAKARKEWMAISRKVVDGRIADTRGGRREALDLTLGSAKEKFEEMRNYLDKLTELNLRMANSEHDSSSAAYETVRIAMLAVIGAGLLVGIILTLTINRGVTKPLKTVIEGLTGASEQVSTGSGQVSQSSQQLAEGSSQQAASIEETSASLEEMSSMTKQNAENAGQANNLMSDANEVVGQANQSMAALTESMKNISTASEETSKIIKTIDEIAFQTNLLALNAAVEAARAGEAGAGFAVVADEVRNLAMRAADAAKNTAELIDGTVKKVEQGSALVAETDQAFTKVAESAAKVGDLVAEIAAASNEQAEGIEQVNKAVTEMDQVTQQNAANAEESASAAEEMNSQADEMTSMIQSLVTLVNGERKGTVKHELKAETFEDAQVAYQRSPVSHTKAVIRREIQPSEVIPLDDNELKDF